MGLEFLVSVIIVGILATFLLFIMGLWAHRLGMPRLDLARGMGGLSFGDSFKDVDPFRTYWPGVYILFMNGIFFAFVYAAAVAQYIPVEHAVVRGGAYGVVLWFLSGVIFLPVFHRAGIMGVRNNKWVWIPSLMVHGIYGLMLGWLSPVL